MPLFFRYHRLRVIPVQVLVVGLALLVSTGAVHAAPTSAVCREAQTTLDALSARLASLEQRHQQLISFREDRLDPEVSLEALLGVDLTSDKAVERRRQQTLPEDRPGEWPESVACKELDARYQELLGDARWLAGAIQREQQQWLALPATLRKTLVALWHSRQRLVTHYHQLEQALGETGVALTLAETLPGRVSTQEHQSRLGILSLMAELGPSPTADNANAFVHQWQALLDTPLLPATDEEALAVFPETIRPLVNTYLRLAHEDALQLRFTSNRLRAWFWEQAPALLQAALARQGSSYLILLRNEVLTLQLSLRDALAGLHEEFIQRPEQSRPLTALLASSARYAFGLSALLLLSYLARRSARPLLRFQERLTHAVKGRRVLTSLARLLSGITPLVPWLLGWLGLALLESLYRYYRLDTLVELMPLARLYVIHGITALFCEWLLLRISQQANVYLSGDQAVQLRPQAQRTATILVVPWLLWFFLDASLGASLLLSLSMLVNILALYIGIGLLLIERDNDLVVALQSILPPRLDPLAESLLRGKRALLLAPLTLLPLLLAFLFGFINKLMLDVDWYRALTARWFKLRVQTSDERDVENTAEALPEKYNVWFSNTRDDVELPYIDSGLLPAIRKPLDRWLEEHTEENTLLLTGERGIGKSQALEKLKATLSEQQPELVIRHASIPARTLSPASLLQLVGRLLECDLSDGPAALASSDESRAPTLLILDDAQNLFLSTVGGLEAWKTLLSLTNTRLENVFWLITIHNQSWAYLSNVFGRDYQFRNVLRAKRWSQHEIRSLILSRNHLSGFRIQYDDILLTSRGPEAGNIRNAEQRYFSLLWDACHGNPMLALRLWLSSVRTRGDSVLVGLPATPSLSQVDKLGSNLLFVYAAIVTHENLTAAEISATTSLPENVVRYALKTGFDAGFIQRSNDGRYRLVPIWYHTITNLLARKNLLNE